MITDTNVPSLRLMTFNARGLHANYLDLRGTLNTEKPDILVLTETKLRDNSTRQWLSHFLKDFQRWSPPNAYGGTIVGIRNAIATATNATLAGTDTKGRHVGVVMDCPSTPLLIIGTYWPSGSDRSALSARALMEESLSTLIASCPHCTPLLMGDMNATYLDSDRSSANCYPADTMYRSFLSMHDLAPLRNCDGNNNSSRPHTHIQATAGSRRGEGQFLYTTVRIDDILLPAAFAAKCPPPRTSTATVLSDHYPLHAHIRTADLNIQIPVLKIETPPAKTKPKRVLVRPITETDQAAFTLAMRDPSNEASAKFSALMQALQPAYDQATTFLGKLDSTSESAKSSKRLVELLGRDAPGMVEDLAASLSDAVACAYEVALTVCTTKVVSTGYEHHRPRPMSKRRAALSKTLRTIKAVQALLSTCPVALSVGSAEDVMEQNKDNVSLCEAIAALKTLLDKHTPIRNEEAQPTFII